MRKNLPCAPCEVAQCVNEHERYECLKAISVEEVISANPDAVTQYRSGKDTVLRFLVGQVMRATKGKANPNLVTDMLKRKLKE